MYTMGNAQRLSVIFLLLFYPVLIGASHHEDHQQQQRHASNFRTLFVFGDSYADTGNNRRSSSSSWMIPYGITFPGRPSGRYSDGRVFTDFVARFLESKTPITYSSRRYMPKNKLKYGMNFAFGGTGVFDTSAPYPNMTVQIDLFQRLVHKNVFSLMDVENSVALVSLAGNDYSAYEDRGGSIQGLQLFVPKVVNQLVLNIQRIYKLGVRKIAVTGLPPLGCLPEATFTNGFHQCNSTINQAVSFHNLLLQQAIAKLKNQTHSHDSPFVILDLYNAFLSVLHQGGTQPGSLMFKNLLKPCCMGRSQNFSCGSVDAMGNKMYTVCEDPKSSFFWDIVHPAQAGWHAISLALRSTLRKLLV